MTQIEEEEQARQSVTIEPLMTDELVQISPLLYSMAVLGKGTPCRVDFQKTLANMRRSMDEEWGVVMAAVAPDGTMIGFLYGFATAHDVYRGHWAFERLLFVMEEWRGRMVGTRLLKCFEGWAQSRGAQYIVAGDHEIASKGERLGKLYERNGYSLIESAYQKEL